MPVIVQVSGTYGSGKSCLIRRFLENRKIEKAEGGHLTDGCFVVGDYFNFPTGIDALSDMRSAFDLMRQHYRAGHSVVMESLMDENELPAMHFESGGSARVLCLTTPLHVCIEAVRQRPWLGDETTSYIEKTTSHYHTISAFMDVMIRNDIPVKLTTREDGPRDLANLLGL